MASKKLGIPAGTVSCWMFLAKKRRQGVEQSSPDSATEGPEIPPVLNASPDRAENGSHGTRGNVAKIYTPSERARALEMAARMGIAGTSRKLKISRFSLYDWSRKVKLAATGKSPESPVSGSDDDIRQVRYRRILDEWKKHPGLGPSQIKNQLRRQGIKAAVHTVRRILEENGYVPPKVKRDSSHDKRYEAVRPNHMWHLDFFHRYVHKQQVFVLLIVDDHSRFIVGMSVWDAERAEAVLQTFESAVSRHGRPEMVMSDGGSAFYAWKGVARFTRYLEELGIDQIIAETPEVNGKSEVLNANVQKELFNQEVFIDLAQTKRRLESWVSFYNFRRTHHALGGLLVPADRYFGRADEVLAQIEAGRPPDAVGEPLPVGERQLDILKVTTQKGLVSVTLMGQQIWPAS
jgi:transposase InsO family protein